MRVLGLVQIDLTCRIRHGFGSHLGGDFVVGLLAALGHGGAGRGTLFPPRAHRHDLSRLPFGIGVGDGAEGLGARGQRWRGHLASLRSGKFGQQRPLRISLDGGDRSRARSRPKSMQRQDRFSFFGRTQDTVLGTNQVQDRRCCASNARAHVRSTIWRRTGHPTGPWRTQKRQAAGPEAAGPESRPRICRLRICRPRNLRAQKSANSESASPEPASPETCKPRNLQAQNLQAQNLQANLVGSSAGLPRRRPTARPCLTPAIGRYFRASRRPCALATPRLSALR